MPVPALWAFWYFSVETMVTMPTCWVAVAVPAVVPDVPPPVPPPVPLPPVPFGQAVPWPLTCRRASCAKRPAQPATCRRAAALPAERDAADDAGRPRRRRWPNADEQVRDCGDGRRCGRGRGRRSG